MIKYLLLSDIHLGHNRTPTSFIIGNLRSFFKKYDNLIKTVDIIFISGDIFDRLLPTNSPDKLLIYQWLIELIKYCSKYDIKLRVLEGTPSHDWKQIKLLYEIIDKFNIDVDFKYFEDIDIEFVKVKDYELSVLYIPDEIYDTADKIWKAVDEKMSEVGLDRVDLIIMHGAFKYQLPVKNLDFLHDENRYLSIVNYLINIGHVHNKSEFEKILCPGSFDRLTFSDENDSKGGWLITIDEDGNVSKKFLENKTAMVFKTIDLTTNHKQIDKILKTLPNFSNIRLLVNKEDSIKSLVKELQYKYPDKRFIIKDVTKSETKEIKTNKEKKKELFRFKINKDNIKDLIKEEIGELTPIIEEELELLISN